MKKAVFLLLILSLPASIFALNIPLSLGSGVRLGYTFTRYTIGGKNEHGDRLSSTQDMDRFDYGGFLFFDAKYAVVSVMLQGGRNSYVERVYYDGNVVSALDGAGTGSEMSLGFSLLGKFPFRINERITWFPMLGAEYHIALIQRRQPDGDKVHDRTKGTLQTDLDKNLNSYPISAWNAWWINIGAGLDYGLTESFFLRGEFLFGIRLPTGYEMGALGFLKEQIGVRHNIKMGGLTGSPTFRISVGYRF